MFTIEQIDAARSKVKSGADFPDLIRGLRKLGVLGYETFVSDGHTDYMGQNNTRISSPAKQAHLSVARLSNPEQFKTDLKKHQRGETSYPQFCQDCAKSGIEKWVVDIEKMTCTYFDRSAEPILVEEIPE